MPPDAAVVTSAEPAVTTPVVEPAKAPVATTPPAEPAKVEPAPTLLGKEGEKPAEPAKIEDKKTDDKKVDAPVAFDAAKLTFPEGMDIKNEQTKGLVDKFSGIISDEKLAPQDRAQALLNLHSDVVKQVGEANIKAWNDTKAGWETEIKADPVVGGDKLQPALQQISKALDTVLGADGAKAFRQGLDITGAGSHPGLVRGMAKFAAALTEGSHVPGAPGKGDKSLAEVFFPNSPDMKG